MRQGNQLSGFVSADGTAWTLRGTVSIAMAQSVTIGLAVTSHADGSLATGVFDNISLILPTPDGVAPSVPQNLSATAAGATQINLAWSPSTDTGGSGLVGDASITSVEGLAGAPIGIVPGSSQEIALRLTLQQAGLDPDTDVETVSLGYADMADALAAGDIDAFAGAEVNASIARLAGAHDITSIYDTPVGSVNIGLATTGTLVEEDPELVQAIVDTHAAATRQLLDDTDGWISGVQEQFSFDGEVLAAAVQNIWLRSALDDDYLAQVEALAEQMVALGTIESAPAVDDVVATGFATESD